jgi:hypothetical protein
VRKNQYLGVSFDFNVAEIKQNLSMLLAISNQIVDFIEVNGVVGEVTQRFQC